MAGPGGLETLVRAAGAYLLTGQGKFLSVPESAVLDTGTQKVVYVETAPGMFDAVQVSLGPRAGAFFPVLAGLTSGQRVATTGAFLLDAETRLNPSLAAGYLALSAASSGGHCDPACSVDNRPVPGPAGPTDREMARQQKTCPITGEPLGSMGTPTFIVRDGKKVFCAASGARGGLWQEMMKDEWKTTFSRSMEEGRIRHNRCTYYGVRKK